MYLIYSNLVFYKKTKVVISFKGIEFGGVNCSSKFTFERGTLNGERARLTQCKRYTYACFEPDERVLRPPSST